MLQSLAVSLQQMQNPFLFSLAKKGTMRMLRVSNNYISVIGIALSNRKFCYREMGKMQCVNREELIRANHV